MKKIYKVLRVFLIIIIILALPLLALRYFGSQTRQINKAENVFRNNQPSLDESIAVLESEFNKNKKVNPVKKEENYIELKKPPMLPHDVDNINLICADGDDKVYILSLGAFGIVPSGSYYGLYYSVNDKPCNLMEPQTPENLRRQTVSERSDSEIWIWQEPGGDNSLYTERIAPHWFTYRQTF